MDSQRYQRTLAYFVKQHSGACISPEEHDQAARDRLESNLEIEQHFDRIERQADVLWDDAVAQGIAPDPNVLWQVATWLTRRGAPAPVTRTMSWVAPRTLARSRGAGRPRTQATRSSAKSGDSGSDDPPSDRPSSDGAAA